MDSERRVHPRQPGNGLMARVGDKLVEVLDMSVTGIKLARSFSPVDGPMAFTLIRRHGATLEINKGVSVTGQVVRLEQGTVAIDFLANSYALAKLAVWHAAGKLGVAPHMVK